MTQLKMRILLAAGFLCASLAVGDLQAAAQAPPPQYTQFGTIQLLEGGWVVDSMAVHHTAPLVNPGDCPIKDAGYATDPKDGGHGLFDTMLLDALINHRQVALLVSGCVYGKPHLIAVQIH